MTRRGNECIVSEWLTMVSQAALTRGKKGNRLATAEAANQLAEATRLGHAPALREPGPPTEDPFDGSAPPPTAAPPPALPSVKTASEAAKASAVTPLAGFFAIN
jgi:hypothetical protein